MVILLVKLKYGIDIAVEPLKSTPPIALAVANIVVVSAKTAFVGLNEDLICISDHIFSNCVELNIPIVFADVKVFCLFPITVVKVIFTDAT